jgi:hypothetical protein
MAFMEQSQQQQGSKGGNVPLAVGASTVAGLGTAGILTHRLQPKDMQLGIPGIGKNVAASSIPNVQDVAEKAAETFEQKGISIPGLADELKKNTPSMGEKAGEVAKNAKENIGNAAKNAKEGIKDAKEGIGNVAKNSGNIFKNNIDKFNRLGGKGKLIVGGATLAATTVAGLTAYNMTKKPSTTLDHNPEAQLDGRVQAQGQAQGRQM